MKLITKESKYIISYNNSKRSLMENLLTKEEIEFISLDSKNNMYNDPNLMHPSFKKTHIMRVSPTKKLILFYGNQDTGFRHIQNRHSSTSFMPFWNLDKKLENPSKFNKMISPIFHYLEIAEQIFKRENIEIEKNYNKELLDLYIGKAIINETEENYKLLLYRDTKIIHTLYPKSSKYNIKRKTQLFYKANVSSSFDTKNNIKLIIIPYRNIENIVVFEIRYLFDFSTGIKTITLHKFERDQEIGWKELEKENVTMDHNAIFLQSYLYRNLSKYEKEFENFR